MKKTMIKIIRKAFNKFSLLILLVILASSSAWSKNKANYQLIMSKDDASCSQVHRKFFVDHELDGIVQIMPWSEVESSREKLVPYCSINEEMFVDLNNDGDDERVVRNTGCLSGFQAHELIVYKKGSDAENFKFSRNGHFYELVEIDPVESVGGLFDIQIVRFSEKETQFFILIRDRNRGEYPSFGKNAVLSKLSENFELEDVCYFSKF